MRKRKIIGDRVKNGEKGMVHLCVETLQCNVSTDYDNVLRGINRDIKRLTTENTEKTTKDTKKPL